MNFQKILVSLKSLQTKFGLNFTDVNVSKSESCSKQMFICKNVFTNEKKIVIA